MKRHLVLLASLLCLAGQMFGATYYIDFDAGDDARAGTSTGTSWKSIPGTRNVGDTADLVAEYGGGVFTTSSKVPAGTTFKLKGGTTWDVTDGGRIEIDSSWYDNASAASPITFQADTNWQAGTITFDGTSITVPIALILVQRDGVIWDGLTRNGILIVNSTLDGIQYKEQAGASAGLLDSVVKNCSFSNVVTSTTSDATGAGKAALSFRRGTGVTVQNVIINGNNRWHNGIKLGESGYGVTNGFISDCSAFSLQGSTSGNDSGIGFKGFNSSLIFSNCISTNNLKGFDLGEQVGTGSNIFYQVINCIASSNIWGFTASDRSGPRTGTHTNLLVNSLLVSNYYNAVWHYGGPFVSILVQNTFIGNGAGSNFNAYTVRLGNDNSERETVIGYLYNNIFYKPSGRGNFNPHYFSQDLDSDGLSLYSDYNSWIVRGPENFAYWGSSEATADNQIYTYGANGPGRTSGNWYDFYSYSTTPPTNGAIGHFHADGNSYASSGSNPLAPAFDASFHLTARYAGSNLSTNNWYLPVMGTDKDGTARAYWDLGAYEFIDLTAIRLSGNVTLRGNATLK